VLDEPTNNLDLEAIEQLELALESYEGAAVLVTHDRHFLEAFGATRTLEL
jgi:ATPase subunit of ABC transporter with duplicated ATPase domains